MLALAAQADGADLQQGVQERRRALFRLEKGHSKASFHGGMIVTNMADPVQDAMIVAMNPEKAPLGVADRCSAVAGKKIPKASYRTADDRKRLFSLKYPLAVAGAAGPGLGRCLPRLARSR